MKAAAAGPGLPLAPPSEKTINRLYMPIPSLLYFFQHSIKEFGADYFRLFHASLSFETKPASSFAKRV